MKKSYYSILMALGALSLFSFSFSLQADESLQISELRIRPTSLVARSDLPRQRVEVSLQSSKAVEGLKLFVLDGHKTIAEMDVDALKQGSNTFVRMLPVPQEKLKTRWLLKDTQGKLLAEENLAWEKPRHWTLYIIKSTHTDIGLHNSQYIQRKMSVDYLDKAEKLVDQTADWPDASRYRYVMEGAWVWGNYEQDRSEEAALAAAKNYIQPGLIGVGGAAAGNHTQAYGMEELCRSAYYRQAMKERWDISTDTMMMCDINGMTWSLVAPYADAGFKNIFFAPNQWNPLPSTLNKMDKSKVGAKWNPDAGGGGSRVDVRWDSPLPMVFYWGGADDKSKLLVWTSTQYGMGGSAFGLISGRSMNIDKVTPLLAGQLAKMEKRYPYDVWLFAEYNDDEPPNLGIATFAKEWNAAWCSPEFRTVGNLSEPFNRLREKFDAQIPLLRGDMTCGWAQHTITVPELLAQKRDADRLLPTAEKLAALARVADPAYNYPAVEFRRAWDGLIWNDEHSYGTSGYKGRRVFETWMQHRDWIDKAEQTARYESRRALEALSGKIGVSCDSVVCFNPTLIPRCEVAEVTLKSGKAVKFMTPEIPSFGYLAIPLSQLKENTAAVSEVFQTLPTIENRFYRITFAEDGSITSLFDKELERELLDKKATFRCNQFVYTQDNHKTFVSPKKAVFEKVSDIFGQTIVAKMDDPVSGASIEQRVSLPVDEKRIEIDNKFSHVCDLFNTNRYYRYGYYAFPFDVPKGTFHAQLNGCIAVPKTDTTGHGTEAYLAAREWVGIDSPSFGVALIQLDSHLVEFGKIHPDKTEAGTPFASSHLYSYLFTDWLQMHTTGGSYINPRYRYVIYSHKGDYRQGNVSRLAERIACPLMTTLIPAQAGPLPEKQSFLSVDSPRVSLLTLKMSEAPGRGLIARFHETDGEEIGRITFHHALGNKLRLTRCSLVEQDRAPLEDNGLTLGKFDYVTLRLEQPSDSISGMVVPALKSQTVSDCCISFRWDAVPGASQYAVYRGGYRAFKPDEFHYLTTVTEPVFEDKNLSPWQTYCYRVGPIHASMHQGHVSDVLEIRTAADENSPPAAIGSVYTGLITEPKAANGEYMDNLYLIWGQNMESDISHYELYRSEISGFKPSSTNFLTDVKLGPYRVGRYEDRGLKLHTTYFYRIRAVDKTANSGPFSAEFSGTTKEPYRGNDK